MPRNKVFDMISDSVERVKRILVDGTYSYFTEIAFE